MLRILLAILLMAGKIAVLSQPIRTDVLVIGGGASGVSAALQAARLKVNVFLAEETPWLGGMLTAAGVSATDGNHHLHSGIWNEFREKIYKHYGGKDKVSTGWVSHTLFEPHVGDSIFKSMASAEARLKIMHHLRFLDVIKYKNRVAGARFVHLLNGNKITVLANIIIDATELGDVMASAGVKYDIGMEASSLTGEDVNITESNSIIQDLTYAATLKDYGPASDRTIPRPAGYDSMEFDGCCNEFCSRPEKLTSNVSAQKMLDYGKLPNKKYMINWPGKGNDIYLNVIEMTPRQREEELKKAKAKTLRFLYFIQKQLGFKHLDLADDEFPTPDKLPFIPYHRESRRMRGMVRFKIQHISRPFEFELYRTGIAVGDYPIDHHHRENPNVPENLGFYPVPSYNVPLGCLIPQSVNGLIVAEKSISVSNVVNGTTRLQPVVMLIGQAAGVLAALSVQRKTEPGRIGVRDVQKKLLEHGAYIMPYYDVNPNHAYFVSIQKTGATGILRGKGEPYAWANRTWFRPDDPVHADSFLLHLKPYYSFSFKSKDSYLTIEESMRIIKQLNTKLNNKPSDKLWSDFGLADYNEKRKIKRGEMAVLLDKALNVFDVPVNHEGKLMK
ncbi:MAG: FAD-dependent oxidoreductase [Chitinophagaceae bacterium]|nr:FAD-dependent oxidoreductase [Chitinophagaceae bacterium]